MRFLRPSLRVKLFLLAALPLAALGTMAFFAVQAALEDRDIAESELIEIDGATILADLAQAVRNERVISTSSMGSAVLPGARTNTDSVFAASLTSPALSAHTKSRISQIEADVAAHRDVLGEDYDTIQRGLELESRTGFTNSLDALRGYSIAALELSDLIETDPGEIGTAESALDLVSFKVINQFEESVRAEVDAYAALSNSQSPNALRTDYIFALNRAGATAQLEQNSQGLGNPAYADALATVVASERYQELLDARDRVTNSAAGDTRIPQSFLSPIRAEITAELSGIKADVRQNLIDSAIQNRDSAQRELAATAAGAVLLAVAALLLSLVLYRSIRRPIVALTARSKSIANEELPAVVALMREIGSDAQLPPFEPIKTTSRDEIGDLVAAFNEMHGTALSFAAQQAASRRTVADMFVNLGRRNQKLLMRLLSHLDSLERQEENPATLEELFKVDHLATRMRRNAESLLVLAGARSTRSFSQPVRVGDLFRATLSEVEEFDRVDIVDDTGVLLDGKVVADLGHLLAELVENALQFSPPDSNVDLVAQETESGYVISVVDRGLGLKDSELKDANEKIAVAAKLTETPSKYLGLYVVGRLIARHGLAAELVAGKPSGLVAEITIPESLLRRPSPQDTTADLDDAFESPQARPELRIPEHEVDAAEAVQPFTPSAEPPTVPVPVFTSEAAPEVFARDVGAGMGRQPAVSDPAGAEKSLAEAEVEELEGTPVFTRERQDPPPPSRVVAQDPPPPSPVGPPPPAGPATFVPPTRRRRSSDSHAEPALPTRPSAVLPEEMAVAEPVVQKRATDPEPGTALPPLPNRPNTLGVEIPGDLPGRPLTQRRRKSDVIASEDPAEPATIFSAPARRSPGANLPKHFESTTSSDRAESDSEVAKTDPETVGWNLAGFQQAVHRADKVREKEES